MIKLFLISSLFILSETIPPSPKQAKEQNRKELIEAGISKEAADGLMDLVSDIDPNGGRTLSPAESIEFLVDLNAEVEKFLKNQTQKDQEIYAKYNKKKNDEIMAQLGTQLGGTRKR